MPDWAPFAPISDAEWRELQRRRNLVKMIRALAESARDEGFLASAGMLADTAERIQGKLIAGARTSEAVSMLHEEARSEASKLAASARISKSRFRAISPNGIVKATRGGA